MWIGAPSIPVVLLQASALLIASVVARSHLSGLCLARAPEYSSGARGSSDSRVERGGIGRPIGRGGRHWSQRWRRSHRGRSGLGARRRRAARVAHVLPAYGCGSYATSRQSGQDYQEPLCELIPTFQSLIALPN